MTSNILVTGANRGLGLEFVQQYAKTDAKLFACCRSPVEASELQALQEKHPNIHIYPLDVTSETSIAALAKQINEPIDILINNAGMLERDPPLGSLSVDAFLKTYLVNAVSPIKMAEAFMKHLSQGKRKLLACISSSMGSIQENTSGGYYSYRASKAALNMIMKSAAIDLMEYGIHVLLLHPGWVKTRMGSDDAFIEPRESIEGMRKVIESYHPKLGEVSFYRYNGEKLSW